jgi:hypothetical protein
MTSQTLNKCGGPQQSGDASLVIYDRGCLRSGEEWVERNLIPVAGVTVAVSVLQVSTAHALKQLLSTAQ